MVTATFAQRLRAIATWMDGVEAERRHGSLRVPSTDEVQRDLRKVADGLDADPTLDEILTDIITRDAPEPDPEPVLEVNPISGYREVVPVPVTGPVIVQTKIYTEVILEGVVIQNVVRNMGPVRATVGGSVSINYRIDLQP